MITQRSLAPVARQRAFIARQRAFIARQRAFISRPLALVAMTALLSMLALGSPRAADIHVDAASGDDARSGISWGASVRSIGRAIAIARAAAGPDRVLVTAGVYDENVVLDLVDTQLLGGHPAGGGTRDAVANPTIIDGGGRGPALVVSADGGLTPLRGITIDGFTFRNGRQLGRASILGAGAGVFVEEAEVLLTNNIFTSNLSDGAGLLGAGLYVYRLDAGPARISNNRFEDNEARNGGGGAAAIVDAADPATSAPIEFSSNQVRNNRALSLAGVDPSAYSGIGGGVLAWRGRPRIIDNIIERNVADAQSSADFAGQGGGMFIMDSAPIVTGNIISSNTARALSGGFGGSGGGAYAWWSDTSDTGGMQLAMSGNTISANRAEGGSGDNQGAGGGVALVVLGDAEPELLDNTVTGNLSVGGGPGSAQGGGVFVYVDEANPGGARIEGGTVETNSAEAGGGGLWLQGGAAGRVIARDMLVRDNRADYGSGAMLFGDGILRNMRIRENRVYDPDGDNVSEISDNCPGLWNPVQADADGDGIGDDCDDDDDDDGIPDVSDPCPLVASGSCAGDADGDAVPDATDNCPFVWNPLQEDATLDNVGDACEPAAFDALETNAGGVWVFGDGSLINVEIVENVGQGLLIVGDAGGGGNPENHSSPLITNATIAENQAAGFITYLANGTRFRDTIIARNLLSDGFDTERVGGVPSSPNVSCNDVYFWDGVASLPCTGTGNMDFTDGDAFFVSGTHGDYYLEQSAAGQARTFVAVDAGTGQASASMVNGLTTRTDDVADTGALDLGFHYSRTAPVTPPGPLDRAVRVTKSLAAVELSLTGLLTGITNVRWYRGDLDILRMQYSHRTPFTGVAGDPECSGAAGSVVDDVSAWLNGNNYYYLTVALDAGVEGSFGTDSLRFARPGPEDSPSDLVVNACP